MADADADGTRRVRPSPRAGTRQSAKYIDLILRDGGYVHLAGKLKYFVGTPRFANLLVTAKLQVRAPPAPARGCARV